MGKKKLNLKNRTEFDRKNNQTQSESGSRSEWVQNFGI